MPLDIARTIDQIEYDALWGEADECGEVPWQRHDFERRRSIPKQLGQGEVKIIELSGNTVCVKLSGFSPEI